jgi:gluconolactonase
LGFRKVDTAGRNRQLLRAVRARLQEIITMSLFAPPQEIAATVWTRLPDDFRIRGTRPDWGRANRPGAELDSFLEGPSFDRDGNLWVTDIPYGRIFRISPAGEWTLAAEYDGWPNGLKIHRDGRIFLADYRHGILCLDPASGRVEPVLTSRYTEHFRGCNDLVFGGDGRLYFTDQGQSGAHMPNGRVYRYDLGADRLDLLIDTGPSPNGLVLNGREDVLYVGMTRANAVWRLPLMEDGGVSKAGVFLQLSGGTGPDGLAIGEDDGLFVAHVGMGSVWGFSPLGEPLWRIRSPAGLANTNLAFGGPDNRRLYVTESASGSILTADLPVAGRRMFSHG